MLDIHKFINIFKAKHKCSVSEKEELRWQIKDLVYLTFKEIILIHLPLLICTASIFFFTKV